jgi:hypothetical protein
MNTHTHKLRVIKRIITWLKNKKRALYSSLFYNRHFIKLKWF